MPIVQLMSTVAFCNACVWHMFFNFKKFHESSACKYPLYFSSIIPAVVFARIQPCVHRFCQLIGCPYYVNQIESPVYLKGSRHFYTDM